MNRRRRLIRGGFGVASVPLLLDLITTQPAAAYGFRKLRNAYSGPCIRIRRSSDNTEQDIGFIGSALDTAAISSFVGVSTPFIVTRYDQTTNANHATQATTTRQPQYSSLSAVMDGVDDHFSLTSTIDYTSGYTIFTTLSTTDTANVKEIVAASGNGGLTLRVAIDESYRIVRQGQALLLISSSTGLTAKATTRWKAGTWGGSIHLGGVSQGSYATDSLFTQPLAVLGAGNIVGSSAFAGNMYEEVIYTGDLSNADSNLIGADMAAFAGTSWTNI